MISTRLMKYATDLKTFPEDAFRAWRTAGAAGVWLELRRRTFDRAGGYANYLVIEADLSTLRATAIPDGIDIRPFTGSDWALLGDMGGHRLTRVFSAAAAAGRICVVAWRDSRAVAYLWLSPQMDQRYEYFALPMPEDAIYVWQFQVALSERRRGIGAAMVSFSLAWARQQGYRRSWMLTRSDNLAAQGAVASVATSRVLGTVRRIKLTSWMRTRFLRSPSPRPLRVAPTA